MSEDMQQDAVDCATQAMEKYNIEKDIAAYIKKVRQEGVLGWIQAELSPTEHDQQIETLNTFSHLFLPSVEMRHVIKDIVRVFFLFGTFKNPSSKAGAFPGFLEFGETWHS